MKAVMISIQPKWCELIANGKKTIEVRKTKPNLKTPFKVYIYCTKDNKIKFWKNNLYAYADDRSHNAFDRCCNGTVIGEFVCDEIECLEEHIEEGGLYYTLQSTFNEMVQLDNCELHDYGKGKPLYGWHISNLVIYDKPKNIEEFIKPCITPNNCLNCHYCAEGITNEQYLEAIKNNSVKQLMCIFKIYKAPQSWCYVEEYNKYMEIT